MTVVIWRWPMVRGQLSLLAFICSFLPHPDTNTHLQSLYLQAYKSEWRKGKPKWKNLLYRSDVMCGGLLFWSQLLLLFFPVASSSLLILYLSMTFSHLNICLFLIFFSFLALSFSTGLCVASSTNGTDYFGLNVLNYFVYSGAL